MLSSLIASGNLGQQALTITEAILALKVAGEYGSSRMNQRKSCKMVQV